MGLVAVALFMNVTHLNEIEIWIAVSSRDGLPSRISSATSKDHPGASTAKSFCINALPLWATAVVGLCRRPTRREPRR